MNQNLYQNKFRVKSTRMAGWDYANPSGYFITICTNKHIPYFGKIIDSNVHLNKIGLITNDCLINMSIIFPHLDIDSYIIMPNHVHFIAILNPPVETRRGVSPPHEWENNQFGKLRRNSISSIINHYKGDVTKRVKSISYKFKWQPGFYQHTIRNDVELEKIRLYIELNPSKWSYDKYFRPNKVIQKHV